MSKKKYNWGLALVAVLALGVVAPKEAGAVASPRKVIWTVGDGSVKILKDGSFISAKPVEMTESSAQDSVEIATTIVNTASFQIITSSGGIVTLTNTPSISTTTAEGAALASGKLMYLTGTSDANAVVLQDDDTLAGSQLELGATTRSLGVNDVLVLIWSATASTTGRWLEVSYSPLD